MVGQWQLWKGSEVSRTESALSRSPPSSSRSSASREGVTFEYLKMFLTKKRWHPFASLPQTSLVRHNGSQCGFCTPGMVMAANTLLQVSFVFVFVFVFVFGGDGSQHTPSSRLFKNQTPSQSNVWKEVDGKVLKRSFQAESSPALGEVEKVMAGQLCRCTGYRWKRILLWFFWNETGAEWLELHTHGIRYSNHSNLKYLIFVGRLLKYLSSQAKPFWKTCFFSGLSWMFWMFWKVKCWGKNFSSQANPGLCEGAGQLWREGRLWSRHWGPRLGMSG